MDNLKNLFENSRYKITEINRFTVYPDWKNRVSFFPYNRIYYVTDGYAVMKLQNRDIVLEKGKCYFIPAFSVITADCPEYLSHFYVHFQTDSIVNNILEYYKPVYELPANGDEQYLIETLFYNFQKDDLYSNLITDGAFKMLLARFFKDSEMQTNKVSRFLPILDYINSHLMETISIKTLAEIMGYTSAYFISIFKATFGISPLQYILSKKLQLSQILLYQQNLSVKEIAFRLGFENEIYFSRLFKQKFGISPSIYKKESNKNATGSSTLGFGSSLL